MRWKILCGVAALAVMLAVPAAVAHAFDVRSGNNIIVESGETIDGNLYAAGSQVVVDGTVEGDVFCAGSTVAINGTVNGDIFCAGSSLTVNGTVNGDVRAAASELSINGPITGGMTAFGSAININSAGSLGSNILAFGATLRADGPVGGDIQFFGASLLLNSGVDGDVIFYGTKQNTSGNEPAVTLRPKAAIGGNLSYYQGVEHSVSEGASIAGETIVMEHKAGGPKDAGKWLGMFSLWLLLWGLFGGLVMALAIVGFFPKQTRATLDVMLTRPGGSIGWGLVTVIVAPVIIILLMVTVIGIPLGILSAVLLVVMTMLAKVLSGIGVGALAAHWFKWKMSLYWQSVIGIILAVVIFSIPFIGWAIGCVAFLWAFGGVVLRKREMYKELEG